MSVALNTIILIIISLEGCTCSAGQRCCIRPCQPHLLWAPGQLLADPQPWLNNHAGYSANWNHAKAWKLSTGALSPLWAAVRPRSTSPGCKLLFCSLLASMTCHAMCMPHVAWWVAPACAAQRHNLSFQPGDAVCSTLARQVFPTVLLLFSVPWGILERCKTAIPSLACCF